MAATRSTVTATNAGRSTGRRLNARRRSSMRDTSIRSSIILLRFRADAIMCAMSRCCSVDADSSISNRRA